MSAEKSMDKSAFYENPLVTRYSSPQMSAIFSDETRFKLWRKLWVALAESEKELGLPITDAQIKEMKKYQNTLNLDVARAREREVRHDVMAHVHAFGEQAKSAMPIIHLGATSCFVTDNSDIIMYSTALKLVRDKLVAVMDRLQRFALKYKSLPTLGFTHFQPAQLVTVGKRASLWLQDLCMDYHQITHVLDTIKLRGVKGTTGTQASFLNLFGGDGEKIKILEKNVARRMGIKQCFAVTGQTYPRKLDYFIVSALSGVAQSAHKFAEDLRLLQHMREVEEPFEKNQIGSSAMAYKRNPMRSERICSLSRYLITLPANQSITAAGQWLERTLDDSANRRIAIPQAFLTADAVLNLYLNVSENLVVNEKIIAAHIAEELPFMLTENIIMECVKAGGDRQNLHEHIRCHSMESYKAIKDGQASNLLERITADDAFAGIKDKLPAMLDPVLYIGRAAEQTDEFIQSEVLPILQKHQKSLSHRGEVNI